MKQKLLQALDFNLIRSLIVNIIQKKLSDIIFSFKILSIFVRKYKMGT